VLNREVKWSESLAVGDAGFIERLQKQLGIQAAGRKVSEAGGTYMLHEPEIAYQAHFEAEKGCLSIDNGVYFDGNTKEPIC